jgi:hypothetical protein
LNPIEPRCPITAQDMVTIYAHRVPRISVTYPFDPQSGWLRFRPAAARARVWAWLGDWDLNAAWREAGLAHHAVEVMRIHKRRDMCPPTRAQWAFRPESSRAYLARGGRAADRAQASAHRPTPVRMPSRAEIFPRPSGVGPLRPFPRCELAVDAYGATLAGGGTNCARLLRLLGRGDSESLLYRLGYEVLAGGRDPPWFARLVSSEHDTPVVPEPTEVGRR